MQREKWRLLIKIRLSPTKDGRSYLRLHSGDEPARVANLGRVRRRRIITGQKLAKSSRRTCGSSCAARLGRASDL